jgi:uncharacterized membrane protein
MASIERVIDVFAPVSVAFNQWMRFESFPQFMEGVEKVEKLDAERYRFVARVGEHRVVWEAQILEEIADLLISWGSTSGPRSSGTVTFSADFGDFTRVGLVVEYEPEQLPDTLGDKRSYMATRVENDLQRFKQLIEGRAEEVQAMRNLLDAGEAFHP